MLSYVLYSICSTVTLYLFLFHNWFSWCSGYHICLTHRRSPVRSRAKTDSILFTFSIKRMFSFHALLFKIWIPWNQFAQVKVWGWTVAEKEIFEEFDFEVLELGSQLPLRKPTNFWPIWAIFDPNDQIAWNQLFPNVAKVPELTQWLKEVFN